MSIKDGWFSETEVLWPGQKFSLEVSCGILKLLKSFMQSELRGPDMSTAKSRPHATPTSPRGSILVTSRILIENI